MQKLDALRILQRVSDALRSPQLEEITRADIEKMRTGNHAWQPDTILPLLIDSKSQYDLIANDATTRRILEITGAPYVYSTDNFARLLRQVSAAGTLNQVYHHQSLFDVYVLHSSLQRLISIFSELLVQQQTLLDETPEDSGVVLFEIRASSGALDLVTLSKIAQDLSDLAQLVQSIVEPGTELKSPQVILLDSGSPTGVAIQTGVETAKSLFQVFKEIWDWWVNHEHYKNRVQVDSLDRNLTILERINAAKASGVITAEKAKEYATLIGRRTDELIGLGVLPKKILNDETKYNHLVLLDSITSTKELPAPAAPALPAPAPEPPQEDETAPA